MQSLLNKRFQLGSGPEVQSLSRLNFGQIL